MLFSIYETLLPSRLVTKKFHCLCLAALVALVMNAAPASAGLVLLDDTWADGSRGETNLPVESEVFVSRNADSSSSVGRLVAVDNAANFKHYLTTYFTANGSPVTLGSGDKLKATIDFTLRGAILNDTSFRRGFRFGLFNDPTTRIAGDNYQDDGDIFPANDNVWTDAEGYAVQALVTSNTGNQMSRLGKRTDLTNKNLLSSSGAYTFASDGGGTITNVVNTPYSLVLEIEKVSATQVDVTSSYFENGVLVGSRMTSDDGATLGTAPVYDTFDQLSIMLVAGQVASAVEFTNFKVELETAIPEPTTMLFSLLAMGSMSLTRSRR